MKTKWSVVVGLLLGLTTGISAQQIDAARIFFGVPTGTVCVISSNSGSPEGVLFGSVCDQYLDFDTGLVYRKASGTATTTGWISQTVITGTQYQVPYFSATDTLGSDNNFRYTGSGTLFLTSDSAVQALVRQYSSNTTGGTILFDKARGTEASPSVITTGDTIGSLVFRARDSVGFNATSSQIVAVSSGTLGAGIIPGELQFWTTQNSTGTLTQRMTIDDAGFVGIGTATPTSELHTSGTGLQLITFEVTDNSVVEWLLQRNQSGGSFNTTWYAYIPSSSKDLRFWDTTDRVTFEYDGDVGIGTTNPAVRLHVNEATATQFRLSYDTSNYVDIGAGSAGLVLLNATGSNAGFAFVDAIYHQAGFYTGTDLLVSATSPTISSGFGTSPSVSSTGTGGFSITIGTGGTASSGVLTMPAATNGWACFVTNITATSTNHADVRTVQTATTTTTVTIENQTISTGAAVAWTAADVLSVSCHGR